MATSTKAALRPTAAMCLVAVALAGCGTTRNFVDHPVLKVAPPSTSPRDAVAAILSGNTPLYVSLCNARESSKQCLPGDSGITAQGVGGLFLPLRLHVRGIRVSAVHQTVDGTAFDGAVDSKVDAIAPLCGSSHAQAVYGDHVPRYRQCRRLRLLQGLDRAGCARLIVKYCFMAHPHCRE
ncbi:MAG: hypothetical protein ACYDAE_11360 [Steroidobacteraceae bacterium]